MKKRDIVIAIALLLCAIIKPACPDEHKLIISVSLPCSLSVAFLRMMRQRGDFFIVHEPGIPAWFKKNYPGSTAEKRYIYAPLTFPEVVDQVKNLVKDRNVFIKEECYAAKEYLMQEGILDARTVFLLRDPHHLLLSLYHKTKYEVPNFLVNYDEMLNLYKLIESEGKHKPFIIHVDDLVKNPHKIIESFCEYADIPFKQESLQWDDLSHNFKDKEVWHESIYAQYNKYWHANAWKSTSFFEDIKKYHLDEQGTPTFEEIEDQAMRAHFVGLYKKMLPAYESFLTLYKAQVVGHS